MARSSVQRTEDDKSAGCRCCSFAGGDDASSGVWTHAATTCSSRIADDDESATAVCPSSGIFENRRRRRRRRRPDSRFADWSGSNGVTTDARNRFDLVDFIGRGMDSQQGE